MRYRTIVTIAAAAAALAAPVWAHDEQTNGPRPVVDNWRDNFFPFFEAGDPNTRHDEDPANDEGRDDADTRQSAQRWRDEVRTDGSVGNVGDGCMETYCTAVADQNGDLVRMDHTVTVGPSTQAGDRNAVVVEVFGSSTEANLGPAQKYGPLSAPDASQAAVTPGGVPASPDPEAPTELHFATAGDHSLLGAAHSNTDHGTSEGNHDSHGGSVWADVFAPSADDADRVRDSRVGIVVLDHLGCQFGCSDEYHTFYPADAERTNYQVSEIPDQAEFVARDPDRWLFGFGPGGPGDAETDRLNPTVSPLAATLFDEIVNPFVDPAVAGATGTGPTSSLCCAVDPDTGDACIPGAIQNAADGSERQAFGGCVEIDADNCFGGGTWGVPPENNGCVVIGGMPFVHGMPADPADCTAAAAAGCCAAGACR